MLRISTLALSLLIPVGAFAFGPDGQPTEKEIAAVQAALKASHCVVNEETADAVVARSKVDVETFGTVLGILSSRGEGVFSADDFKLTEDCK